MLVKQTAKIVDIWKSKEDGWCLKTKTDNKGIITYIRLKQKPQKKVGSEIRKGTEI